MAIKQITGTPSISPEGKSIAKIREIRGKSLVWNQLVASISESRTSIGLTFVNNNNKSVTITGTANTATTFRLQANINEIPMVVGHKYYASCGDSVPQGCGMKVFNRFFFGQDKVIFQTTDTDASSYFGLSATINSVWSGTYTPLVIDLTLMFGAGNEPETVEEFEAMFPENYYEYNSGEIINSNINAIEAVGFNQWDEEMELGTYGQSVNISKVDNTTQLRNVNPIPVFPNTTYCLTCKSNSDGFFIALYDSINSDKTGYGTVIQRTAAAVKTFTTGPKTRYVCFSMAASYGTTYKNDICFSFSDQSRNGTYEPYKKSILPLNISTLTGKLNGEGESVVLCADGAKSAGSVYDEFVVENGYITKFVKRIGQLDLGSLIWTSKTLSSNEGYKASLTDDVAVTGSGGKGNAICEKYEVVQNSAVGESGANKVISVGAYWGTGCGVYLVDSSFSGYTGAQVETALSDVMLNYELATPQTYVLDTPILMEYNTDGGTEQIVFSENLLSTPLVADIDYFNSAIKHIQFNEEKHCIRDERITGIDSTPTKNSSNIVTSGGVADYLKYNNILPISKKTFSNVLATSSNVNTLRPFFRFIPTNWNEPAIVNYKVKAYVPGKEDLFYAKIECCFAFFKDALCAYHCRNFIGNTSYRPIYYNSLMRCYQSYNNIGHLIGINYYDAGNSYSRSCTTSGYGRTFEVEITYVDNGTVVWLDSCDTVANSVSGYIAGTTHYGISNCNGTTQGDTHSGDANSNTIGYYLRTPTAVRATERKLYRYRICFSSVDDKKWVPADTSTLTNATGIRDVNQTPINPLGHIVYYSTTTAIEANTNVAVANIWRQYDVGLGYSFNRTGSALSLTFPSPVYVKCAPQSDGSAIIDSTEPFVQTLPNTDDSKIYIYLGEAYSATNISLTMDHPIYYYDGTRVRLWTGDKYLPLSDTEQLTSAEIAALLNL